MTEKTCTKAAECINCGYSDGSKLPHNWKEATCTDPKVCTSCGKIDREALGHNFGEWEVIEEATRKHEGCEERVCKGCGLVETRVIPVVPPKYTPETIVAVVISAVLFSIAVLTLILWRLRKQDYLK